MIKKKSAKESAPRVTSLNKTELLDSMRNDMELFGKVCMPNMFTAPVADFHKELYEIFENREKRKVCIVAPRHHAKSSIGACVFPLHHLLFDEGPKLIVLSSKTLGHSIRLLDTIKNVLEYSRRFHAIFGYWGSHTAKQWSKTEIALKDGSLITTRGTGQQVIGLKHGDQRPTLILVDDPEDINNTKTTEAMEMNLKWLMTQLLPSMDARVGRLVVIGTPQHQRCLVETLPQMKGWETRRYQAMSDDGKNVLWPEMWSKKKLLEEKEDLESIGRVSMFYREYMCQIIGDEDQMFREEDILEYDGEIEVKPEGSILKLTYPDEKEIPVNIFMGVDPASSTKQTADYSTIVPVAIDADNNRYVLPYFRRRIRPVDLAEAILMYYNRYRPEKTKIETVGYQEMLRDYLRRKCEELNIFIPGLEVKNQPRTAKSVRLEGMQPFFFQKKMFIRKDMEPLKNELLMYPRGKHDDLLDGLYYGMKGAYKPSHDGTETNNIQDTRTKQGYYDWAIL